MEESTFKDARVRAAFERVVNLAVYVDEKDKPLRKKLQELQERLVGAPNLPAYLVLDPVDERVLLNLGFKMEYVTSPATFAEELEAALSAFSAR